MPQTQAMGRQVTTLTRGRRVSTRWIFLSIATITILLLGLLPPLVSVNRYQHRISTSISTGIGRPVHFDHVSLNLLPVPSFTITNFVVEEDPAFGAEPIIRSNAVTASLRVASLWRRRIEFSRISFTEPTSINLVHDRRGRWNLEGILLQAAHIETAPTAQPDPGSSPRFPYIEATGARVNLKEGVDKTPFSLTEADLALWRPDPGSWRIRLKGKPIRTDTSVSDTGSLQVEATLGRAASLDSVPLQLDGSWRGAPLGEASTLVLGRDIGLRGEVTLTGGLHGTLSLNNAETRLQITGLRRSDFVPEQPLSLNLTCTGTAMRAFHAISDLRCSWPVPDAGGATLALAGSIPDTLRPGSADVQIGTSRLPAAVLLSWLRVGSSRIPPTLSATGLLSGSLSHDPEAATPWTAQATMPELQLSGAKLGPSPLSLDDLFLRSSAQGNQLRRSQNTLRPSGQLVLAPLSLPLGSREPALLEGFADAKGYSLHLSGMIVLSQLQALGASIPQFGDGLLAVLPTNRAAGPVHLDLSSRRDWIGKQVWTDNLAHTGPPPRGSIRTSTGTGKN